MKLSILYRGSLASCNYGCPYCPFAKHRETLSEHRADAASLDRFIEWVAASKHEIAVFFTPWGEALIHRRYQQAFIRLSQMSHVSKVAIQTNLSCRLEWLDLCEKSKIALWATYHPGEVSQAHFLAKCETLIQQQVRFSVGIVGMKEHLEAIQAMRQALPPDIYVWVNAYKRVADYYTLPELALLETIDPLFPINNQRHPSFGKACHTGESVFSVDGEGTMRRCHFIKTPIGNIYEPDFEKALQSRLCSTENCGCHIGYVHMPDLGLYEVFGDGVLERIPSPVRA